MGHSSSLSGRGMLLLYVAMWSVLLVAAGGWLTLYLVRTLGNPLAGKDKHVAKLKVFDSVVALTEKKVARYLGEWEFQEPKLPGHFHHIGRWYQADTRNFCIHCHGQTPHSRSPQVRAFLNMHNLFISCQTCHIREKQDVVPTRFGWADITTGQLCSSPDMATLPWGEYGAKIVPVTGPEKSPVCITLDEEEAFAAEFLKHMNELSDQQKAVGKTFVHRRCTETPVRCSDCHNIQKAFLPYAALGYTKERTTFLMSAEVADLVARYETFHMPSLLKAGEPAQQETPEGKK
jgi:hypothetical protein